MAEARNSLLLDDLILVGIRGHTLGDGLRRRCEENQDRIGGKLFLKLPSVAYAQDVRVITVVERPVYGILGVEADF
jgi:hypothetical protein